jgi:hypothetical protein
MVKGRKMGSIAASLTLTPDRWKAARLELSQCN